MVQKPVMTGEREGLMTNEAKLAIETEKNEYEVYNQGNGAVALNLANDSFPL